MRLNPFSRTAHRVATEPLSPTAPAGTPTAPGTASPHPLSHAPKTGTTKRASKSRQGMLTLARQSLATLRKQLPSMCVGSSVTKTTSSQPPTAPAPAPHDIALRVPTQRPPLNHAAVDARWEAPSAMPKPRNRVPTQTATPQRQPLPTALNAARPQPRQGGTAERWQRQAPGPARRDQIGQPQQPTSPVRPAPSASRVSPPQAPPTQSRRLPAVRNMNLRLAALSKQCYDISQRLYDEDRPPRPEEQAMFETRAALIAERNAVRDQQLDDMLAALAPLEKIAAPKTTSSGLLMVQTDVMQSNRHALLAVGRDNINMTKMAVHYARAQRRLESLKESDAPHDKIRRLQRMMQGYTNLLALNEIVKRTDDQLQRMGAPRLMDSIPTTRQERAQYEQSERDAHQEAIDNGYY
ncbi:MULTISPECIES: type III secretion system effector protein XopR [Xanthomonas]|uniref:Type III secretion protein n=1 Tax=Xanthomonas cucurbitae TaxID=56453 RepID=A0ABY7Y9X1_9XANT|nr:type III secretion system effector protein XopR [Xanthomonas cucurbitae]WDM66723.1 hypothetical protein K6981_14500 [Xanthomonas cucurbitae]WDM70600.1 hypothetical protein K6978_14470 [Xanthomonas cucurbitae]WDM74470.1 hypothetical protein K6982_13800 [Xanthomonas cucurbitae]